MRFLKMSKEKLSDKIVKLLVESKSKSMSLWDIANHLYDNCMKLPKSWNGVKIANIRRSAENDDRLSFYINGGDEGFVRIK